jgi:hypothetical protein
MTMDAGSPNPDLERRLRMLPPNRVEGVPGFTTAAIVCTRETVCSGAMLPSPPLPKNVILSKSFFPMSISCSLCRFPVAWVQVYPNCEGEAETLP